MLFRLFILFSVFFAFSVPAYAADVTEITAALDGAQSQADIVRQTKLLESITAAQAPCPRVDALTQLGRA